MLHKSKMHNHSHFLAHGMGLVSHEAPRLTNSGPVPYDAYDADRPLETGMVISVETTLQHPRRGFIKLEDTVVVTPEAMRLRRSHSWLESFRQRLIGLQGLDRRGRGISCRGRLRRHTAFRQVELTTPLRI